MSLSIGYNEYLGFKVPFLDYGQGPGYTPIEKKTIVGGQIVGTGAVTSLWNGLSTTGKVVVGAGVGAGGYAAYDWLFGSKKQPMAPQTQVLDQKPVQNNPIDFKYNYDARQYIQNTTNQDNRSWMNIINSPNASMTKKDSVAASATATPTITTPFSFSSIPTQETSAEQKQSQASGIDYATIAAIAGVALVAYGYTSRKGSK